MHQCVVVDSSLLFLYINIGLRCCSDYCVLNAVIAISFKQVAVLSSVEYGVSQKKVAPPKLFAIFLLRLIVFP